MSLILEKGHSRVPVYYEQPTNIIGLILVYCWSIILCIFYLPEKKVLSILQNILEFMEWFYKQILVKKSMLVFFSFFFRLLGGINVDDSKGVGSDD